jgi:Peptidase family M28
LKQRLPAAFVTGYLLWTLLCPSGAAAQSNTSIPPPLSREVIAQRLNEYAGSNLEREHTLKNIFEEAGCRGKQLVDEPFKKKIPPNLICTRAGGTASVILVGAHFDYVDAGRGVVDNWSGASLLPSLYQSLGAGAHKHTFVFVGFSGEETGLFGSKAYVKSLTREERAAIHAMINLDSLGLGPTKVWATHSSPMLVVPARNVARALGLSLGEVDADQVGDDDSHPFIERKVPTLMIHSVTQETFPILHSRRDNISAIDAKSYYDTYRLLVALLRYLDLTLD